MNSRLLVMALCISLLLFSYLGLFSAGTPRIYCPLPILTMLPVILLQGSWLPLLVVLIPSIMFITWTPRLLQPGYADLPKRTVVLTALLSILSIFYFTASWKYGLAYQGQTYTIIMCLINAVWLVFLWLSIIHALRRPSFKATLLSHWLLFVWLSWHAFPYLGELP
jgi:hypothetical protein